MLYKNHIRKTNHNIPYPDYIWNLSKNSNEIFTNYLQFLIALQSIHLHTPSLPIDRFLTEATLKIWF